MRLPLSKLLFGKLPFGKFDKETNRLVSNFNSSVNTILVSPRRWGKSSLVLRASKITKAKNKKIRFCFIDLNNVRTEEQFYQQLATGVLKVSSTKIDDIIGNAKKFMGRFIPNVTFSPDQITDISLSLDWKEVKKSPDDILDMAEKISRAGNIQLVICMDEFQNITGSMPFYKFGDLVFLEKISVNDWNTFIRKRFSDAGKKIGTNDATLIAEMVECHPYYVQHWHSNRGFGVKKFALTLLFLKHSRILHCN